MKYEKNEQYLGGYKDLANHKYDAFKIDEEIHIVYYLDTPQQYASVCKVDTITNNLDAYLWTPFAEVVNN